MKIIKKASKNVLFLLFFLNSFVFADDYKFDSVSARFNVDSNILRAISSVESKHNNTALAINYGTIDVGHMQINSFWEKKGIDLARLLTDPVYCTETGAYILKESQNRYGKSWASVGSYHSGYAPLDLPNLRRFFDCIEYIQKVMVQYSKITGLSATAYANDMFSGKVVKVLDGDTIKIKDLNKILTVRFYGIDAPETKHRCGQNAKKFVSDLILNKKVFGVSYGQGCYGRVIASIYLKKKSLSKELLKNGFAWVYPKHCKANFCNNWFEIQKTARRRKIGLWQDKTFLPLRCFDTSRTEMLDTQRD